MLSASLNQIGRRRLAEALAAFCATAALIAAPACAASSPSQLAAQACASGHAVSADLDAGDYSLLRRFVPCVLLDFLGHRTGAISPSWNQAVATTMIDLERAPRRHDNGAYVTATVRRVAHPVLSRIEPKQFRDCAKFSMREGDTTPPPITMADVAAQIQLAVAVIPPGAIWETWGFYVGHRPLFHDGPRHNISWAVEGVAGAGGC